MTQWTNGARELIKQENERFEREVIQNAPKVLEILNEERRNYGLSTWKRINKDVVKETVLYLLDNTSLGGAKRKEINIFENEVRSYQ